MKRAHSCERDERWRCSCLGERARQVPPQLICMRGRRVVGRASPRLCAGVSNVAANAQSREERSTRRHAQIAVASLLVVSSQTAAAEMSALAVPRALITLLALGMLATLVDAVGGGRSGGERVHATRNFQDFWCDTGMCPWTCALIPTFYWGKRRHRAP